VRAREHLRRLSSSLSAQQKHELDAELDAGIERLLPVLGPAFGASVILFTLWDYWLDPAAARLTVAVRCVLVAVGALGYTERFGWPVLRRCAFIYSTHAVAMVASSAYLANGMVLGLPGLTGTLFPLALVEPRVRRLLAIAAAPALLYIALAFQLLPLRVAFSCALLYLVSAGLAASVSLVGKRLRTDRYLLEQALLRAARYDSLSGALARGYVCELATHDIALAQRHGRALALALIDIDHFKRVNDTHGHATGDEAIRALVTACTHELRASDHLGRIGGEEFVCVMPETGAREALACAERMRQRIEALELPTAQGALRFTVSIGVSALGPGTGDWTALLSEADHALYRAKASGRNRTVLAQSCDMSLS
jgi:diguanylate cyclase (GGDEF)-like protein